jgi:hypothetical protein
VIEFHLLANVLFHFFNVSIRIALGSIKSHFHFVDGCS